MGLAENARLASEELQKLNAVIGMVNDKTTKSIIDSVSEELMGEIRRYV